MWLFHIAVESGPFIDFLFWWCTCWKIWTVVISHSQVWFTIAPSVIRCWAMVGNHAAVCRAKKGQWFCWTIPSRFGRGLSNFCFPHFDPCSHSSLRWFPTTCTECQDLRLVTLSLEAKLDSFTEVHPRQGKVGNCMMAMNIWHVYIC